MSTSIPNPAREAPAHAKAAWVAKHLGRALTDAEAALVGVACRALNCNPWNLAWGSLLTKMDGAATLTLGCSSLTTFDPDSLTRLVFAAHDAACRVAVEAQQDHALRLRLHLRDPEAVSTQRRHDELEKAVVKWRAKHPITLAQPRPRCEAREDFWGDPDHPVQCERWAGHEGPHHNEPYHWQWSDDDPPFPADAVGDLPEADATVAR